MAARQQAGQEFAGVAAVTQRAIDRAFAGARGEDLEQFGHHDGAVRAGGRFSGSENLSDGVLVFAGIVFFVFFVETTGIFAGNDPDPIGWPSR